MAKRDLGSIWTVLESSVPSAGIEASGTGYFVAAGEVLAGVDADRRRSILVPLLPGEVARTDTKGRAVQLRRLSHGDTHYLEVVCGVQELFSVFTQFGREILESVESTRSPAHATSEAFERWRALFSEAMRYGVIGEEQLIGLLGELVTLRTLLTIGAPGDLHYWRGPLDEPHDFRAGQLAFEVKSTLAREGRVVSISGVDQLAAPVAGHLVLIHHQFNRLACGVNVRDLVEEVESLGARHEDLAVGLRNNGLYIEDLSAYGDKRYELSETRSYDVESEAFPRIIRGSFVGGKLPPGTLRMSYSIDLTNEPPYPLSADAQHAELTALVKEADGLDS